VLDESLRHWERVEAGKLELEAFEVLRHLMQHYDWLNFIFSIGSCVEELAKPYALLFNVALYKRISCLEAQAASHPHHRTRRPTVRTRRRSRRRRARHHLRALVLHAADVDKRFPRGEARFFRMRMAIWNSGPYARYPDKPELQMKWFVDTARKVRRQHQAVTPDFGTSSSDWVTWVADIQLPMATFATTTAPP
jgi:hypothetical protein